MLSQRICARAGTLPIWGGQGWGCDTAPHCVCCSAGVTDDDGALTSQQRYLPFGGVRQLGGSFITQTDYGYTGQRDNSYIKLMDYDFRWYKPELGRFISPDSIVPNPSNPQSLNRYSYVGNRPINFNDPSGHEPGTLCQRGYCDANKKPIMYLTQQLGFFGISTNGTEAQNEAALKGARLVGDKLADTMGGDISAQDAFLRAHGNITIIFSGRSSNDCETNNFGTYNEITCGDVNESWFVQTLIHEYGHVFDNHFKAVVGGEFWASSYPENGWDATVEGYKPGYEQGYPSMQHPYPRNGPRGRDEDFADMYLNWVLDMNPAYPHNGFTNDDWGNDRRDMMNNPVVDATYRGMPVWLEMMGIK